MKTINFDIGCSTFYFGNFSELKKRILLMGARYIKNYHGDLFISYKQLEEYINDMIEGAPSIDLFVSCHENGSDFWGDVRHEDQSDYLFKRAMSYHGVIIAIHIENDIRYSGSYFLEYKIIRSRKAEVTS